MGIVDGADIIPEQELEPFLVSCVDGVAATKLRDSSREVQQAVLAQGVIKDVENPSGTLLARITREVTKRRPTAIKMTGLSKRGGHLGLLGLDNKPHGSGGGKGDRGGGKGDRGKGGGHNEDNLSADQRQRQRDEGF